MTEIGADLPDHEVEHPREVGVQIPCAINHDVWGRVLVHKTQAPHHSEDVAIRANVDAAVIVDRNTKVADEDVRSHARFSVPHH
ncbi:MAG: hypothetical protein IPO51_15265 [Dehalococcoidia bacterium]|nr:hypothetical protein [Dehalococcoidia bacterium]